MGRGQRVAARLDMGPSKPSPGSFHTWHRTWPRCGLPEQIGGAPSRGEDSPKAEGRGAGQFLQGAAWAPRGEDSPPRPTLPVSWPRLGALGKALQTQGWQAPRGWTLSIHYPHPSYVLSPVLGLRGTGWFRPALPSRNPDYSPSQGQGQSGKNSYRR